MSALSVELNCLRGLLTQFGFTEVGMQDGRLHMAAPSKRITVILDQPQLKAEARLGNFTVAVESIQFTKEGINVTFHIR
ncbi:MAG: hypothetical protein ABSE73_08490 [Planctomycetota bacterium]